MPLPTVAGGRERYAVGPPQQPYYPSLRERMLIEGGGQPTRVPFDPFVVVAGEDPRQLPPTSHSTNAVVRNVSKTESTTESSGAAGNDTSSDQSDEKTEATPSRPAAYTRIHHPIVYSLPLGGALSSSYRKSLLERGCLNRVVSRNPSMEGTAILSTGRPLSLPPLNNGCLGADGKACKGKAVQPTKDEGDSDESATASAGNIECSSTSLRLIMIQVGVWWR